MNAPNQGTKISSRDQPNLPHPDRVWSENRSKMQRNQIMIAEIMMKNQKLHRSTSQKLVDVEVHLEVPFVCVWDCRG